MSMGGETPEQLAELMAAGVGQGGALGLDTPQQLAPNVYYVPPQMQQAAQAAYTGRAVDPTLIAQQQILNRAPTQYQPLVTPDTYQDFYKNALQANTGAYSGLAVPNYNDPNSKYLPPPPPSPPAPVSSVFGSSGSGSSSIYGGGDGFAGGPGGDDGIGEGIGASGDAGLGGPSGGGGGGGDGGDGCCFIMLEARYGDGTMDNVVRKYRDQMMTDKNRRGYYKLAEVFVPLMRRSRVFKFIVQKTFADPLVSYGKWHYKENKHGWVFAPIKSMWMKVFDVLGGDTEFIRENGQVV